MNSLFVAWRGGDAQQGVWGPVGRLDYEGGVYRFRYTCGAQRVGGFSPFPGMPDLEEVYESEELFPLFANRLLKRSRPEYEAFLRWGGFAPGSQPEPIAILGVTEGIRQTDSIEVFPCPTQDPDGCYLSRFFLHGIRWRGQQAIERINRLQSEEELVVRPDPGNRVDPNAVGVHPDHGGAMIGFVPRYLAHDVKRLLEHCGPDFVKLFVERVNRDAPLQQRVLCRMRACWPEGFQPCNDEAFQPIPTHIPSQCQP
jgi:HIRAN domain